MDHFQDKEAVTRGSRNQIAQLRELNARPETTPEERGEYNLRIHEHLQAIEKRDSAGK